MNAICPFSGTCQSWCRRTDTQPKSTPRGSGKWLVRASPGGMNDSGIDLKLGPVEVDRAAADERALIR